MPERLSSGARRWAQWVSIAGLAAVFVVFIYGVGMRYLFNRPVGWADEVVTLLAVWTVLWTAAFVLRWSEFISFDVLFVSLKPGAQRLMLLVANSAFALLMLAALPAMIDYTLFLWREKTDMLELRLDFVYAIFPVFFIGIVVRQLLTIRRLLSAHWQQELLKWKGEDSPTAP